jgi:hypothetical protein
MKNHRSARARSPSSKHVSADAHQSFSPADALESLHTEIVQLEAFAHVAGEVITRLSPPANRAERRDYIRLYALVTKVADDAIKVVSHGDALVAALSAHLAAQAQDSSSMYPSTQ